MNQPNNDSPEKRLIDIYIETDNDIPPGHLRIEDIKVWPKMQQRALARPIGEIEELPEDQRLVHLTQSVHVERYKEMLKLSAPPPLTVYKIDIDDNNFDLVLVDGFNRLLASINKGRKTIPAIVIKGTEIEAIRASCIANGYYRQKLSNSDQQCAYFSYYYSFSEEERNGNNKEELTVPKIAAALGVDRRTINSTTTGYMKTITKQMKRDDFRQKKEKIEDVDLWKDAGIPVYRGSQIIEKQNEVNNGINPEYLLSECEEKTGFKKSKLEQWVRAINRKRQAIIQGPPGTGKTYLAKQLAEHLIGEGDADGFQELVQFHPAYSYEDFMQGIRPQTGKKGELTYPMVPGRFLEFCKKAESRNGLCVLIIDEINRANLSQVFGELMYLLEYRSVSVDEKIPLAGSIKPFGIPKNVRIIGTMNTADRSIALIDFALRRRFAFITLSPDDEVLKNYHKKKNPGLSVELLIAVLKELNNKIDNPHYKIGMSFFMSKNLIDEIEDIWIMEIEPYLEEYFFDQRDKVALEEFCWKNIGDNLKKSFAEKIGNNLNLKIDNPTQVT